MIFCYQLLWSLVLMTLKTQVCLSNIKKLKQLMEILGAMFLWLWPLNKFIGQTVTGVYDHLEGRVDAVLVFP
ncbi:hypothetical protein GIB67_029269 [Kingdonia uniflora]|uniref:Uncharacterized protein n=1 Tax=Kingdonia uniflora TaxID=39325 RepID=A0A7J7N8T2_9MAGN|nr:hypothetical protein GIB67_029269 [Kingdonia uniflora]